jgi:hypothetical protein
MKKLNILLGVALLLIIWNCSEVQDWSDPKDNIAPGMITNAQVENLNGGARITYTLPGDNDLLGVKAVYSFSEDGEVREAFSSAFRDTIELVGFPDTDEYTVELITLDKSKNESDPVELKIKPLTPPVNIIRQTLKVSPAFGGLYTTWLNEMKENIAISLYSKNSTGEFALYDTYYTEASEGQYAFRGLENTEKEFRIVIRDRWKNYSNPLDTILTPLFEEEIVGRDDTGDIWQRYGFDDKTCIYRGDISSQMPKSHRQFRVIHNGSGFHNHFWWGSGPDANKLEQFIDWPDSEYEVEPIYFTIDMGRKASYSRHRFWMRSREPLFSAQCWTSYEIWGTNELKPINEVGNGSKEDNLKYWTNWPEVEGTDEWKNDWVKLADCVLTLPSGETDPSLVTEEDREFIRAGFEFEMFPEKANEPFRYLRFVIRESKASHTQIQLAELKFWGAYQD